MNVLRAISAIFFLLGCFAILLAIFVIWAYLLVLVALQSVVMGWIIFLLSVVFWGWQKGALQAPWAVWYQVWRWIDEELDRRLIRGIRNG